MKKKIALAMAAVLLVCAAFTGCSPAKTIPQSKSKSVDLTGYELTFEDNFDGDSVNTTYWQYPYKEEGVRKGGYWVDDAVQVKDGNLIITTDYRKDGKFGEGWYGGCIETAAESYTGSKSEHPDHVGFSQTYGYFEVRCKVPAIQGSWAAFWMMPDSNFKDDRLGTGEDGAEIDIFESMYFSQKDNKVKSSVTHAIHVDGYQEDEIQSLGSDYFYVKNLYEDFHTYGLKWTKDEYVFYVDGQETWRTKDKLGTVAQVSHYLMLSMETGGAVVDGKPLPGRDKDGSEWWCGDSMKNDLTPKYEFVVDYVKVYQKQA